MPKLQTEPENVFVLSQNQRYEEESGVTPLLLPLLFSSQNHKYLAWLNLGIEKVVVKIF